MAWPKLFAESKKAESKKVEQLTTEVDLLRTDVTSLTNLITKAVIPNVLTAVDALDGVVAATDATVEGLQSATAIDQSLQGATGGSSGTSPATSTKK
jgi:hypothetical protein